MKDHKYQTYEELLPFVDQEVEYTYLGMLKRGLMTKDKDKDVLWLPSCGFVKATTVKTKIVKM